MSHFFLTEIFILKKDQFAQERYLILFENNIFIAKLIIIYLRPKGLNY